MSSTTTTIEIYIPIREIEDESATTSTSVLLLPTVVTNINDDITNNNRQSLVLSSCTYISKSTKCMKARLCMCFSGPPPLKLRNMATSSTRQQQQHQKPIELMDDIISDDDYHTFCQQMNTCIQQYDILINRREKMEYYQRTTMDILFWILTYIFFINYHNLMNNNNFTIGQVLVLILRYIGYSILVITIHGMIYVYCTYFFMKQVKDETISLYTTVNQFCSDYYNNASSSSSFIMMQQQQQLNVTVNFRMVWKNKIGMSGRYNSMDGIKIAVIEKKTLMENTPPLSPSDIAIAVDDVSTTTTTTTTTNDSTTSASPLSLSSSTTNPTNNSTTKTVATTTSEQGVTVKTTTSTTRIVPTNTATTIKNNNKNLIPLLQPDSMI